MYTLQDEIRNERLKVIRPNDIPLFRNQHLISLDAFGTHGHKSITLHDHTRGQLV